MNSKKTNRLVAILNIVIVILVITLSVVEASADMMLTEDGKKSVFNSSIIDILANNTDIIIFSLFLIVAILNITCSIQNRKNKKQAFWQVTFGISLITNGISVIFEDYEEIIDWGKLILYGIIPIILATKNLILIKKNKPKVIQVISYVVSIIISILYILKIISSFWLIISMVMQFIYIHYQEKKIEESRARKIVNIILYWILELILFIVLFGMTIIALFIIKINENKIEEPLSQLYDNIQSMKDVKNSKLLIPVENDNKYGFINQNGEEKIPCEYDRVSFFYEIEIDNSTYYVALAKNNDEFYIISKSNDYIPIEGELKKYLQGIEGNLESMVTNEYDLEGDYKDGYVYYFGVAFTEFMKVEKISYQELEKYVNIATLEESNYDEYRYYYYNGNYLMDIELVDDGENYSLYNSKYNVTITKTNGEKKINTVYLPGFNGHSGTLEVFSNGFIEFENEERTRRGWYDNEGNQVTIPIEFEIMDIKDDIAILQRFDVSDEIYGANFIIIDMTGRTLLQSPIIAIYDDKYLIENDHDKMVLIDSNLNEISNEYDKIITNRQTDVFGGIVQ